MAMRLFSVVFDANDHIALAHWWAQALETGVVAESEIEAWFALTDSPELIFVPVAEPKTSKNRIHLDLPSSSGSHQSQIVERLVGLGASHADIGQQDVPWVVLADPEDNEFCVLTAR